IATTSPSTTVSSANAARAARMAGYFVAKSLSFRERRWILPPDFTAMARYPSSFSSYIHCAPSGSLSVRNRSIGSMKRARTLAAIYGSHTSIDRVQPTVACPASDGDPHDTRRTIWGSLLDFTPPIDPYLLHCARP